LVTFKNRKRYYFNGLISLMKIVREHINEKFEVESDPIQDLGIGNPKLFGNFKIEKKLIEIIDKELIPLGYKRETPEPRRNGQEDYIRDVFNWVKGEDEFHLYFINWHGIKSYKYWAKVGSTQTSSNDTDEADIIHYNDRWKQMLILLDN